MATSSIQYVYGVQSDGEEICVLKFDNESIVRTISTSLYSQQHEIHTEEEAKSICFTLNRQYQWTWLTREYIFHMYGIDKIPLYRECNMYKMRRCLYNALCAIAIPTLIFYIVLH